MTSTSNGRAGPSVAADDAQKTATASPSSRTPQTTEESSAEENDAVSMTTSTTDSSLTVSTDNATGTITRDAEVEDAAAGATTTTTATEAGESTSSTLQFEPETSATSTTTSAAASITATVTRQLQQILGRLTASRSNQQPVDPTEPKSLAYANSTPCIVRYFIPLLCIIAHIVFYYGQTIDMWKLRLTANIDVWANATDLKSKQTFDVLGFDRNSHYVYHHDDDVETFTYWYAIRQLWIAKGMPGKVMPRFAAVLLVLFSGVWPHLKLFLLQVTWWTGRTGPRRTRMLRWLSTLGKWSLADVLTVCVMVGVLHLDWDVDPAAIKTGLVGQLPSIVGIIKGMYNSDQLCDILLKVTCKDQTNLLIKAKCKACWQTVHEMLVHPDWAQSTGRKILRGVETSGGGETFLRVEGMAGIYAFCAAVILSILISVMVDVLDHRANQQEQEHQLRRRAFQSSIQQQQQSQRRPRRTRESPEYNESESLEEPLLVNHMSIDSGRYDENEDNLSLLRQQRFRQSDSGIQSTQYLILASATLALVFFAVDFMTMERVVDGAAPKLLHDILGVAWKRKYSLQSLMWTTGAAGGWDYLLMGTFALFCVIGPIFRACLCVLLSVLDRICCCGVSGDESNNCFRRAAIIRPIATTVNFVGSFCAWEVFVIAILMVDMLMPSITNTIIQNPACAKVQKDGSCLQVEFNVLPYEFATIVIGGFLLISAATTAIGTMSTQVEDCQRQDSHNHLVSRNNGPHDAIFYELVGGASGQTMRRSERDTEQLESALEELVFETEQV